MLGAAIEKECLSRFSLDPVSWLEFERIDLAIISLLANQPVASESERDQCQSAGVTPPVNLSFSFPSRISQLTVSVVVSAIATFRLVDHMVPTLFQIVH